MSQLSEMLSAWSWKDSGIHNTSIKNSNLADHLDFLSFLAVVQELGVSILPITWNDGPNSIGFGGTAVLREAMVDLNTSFAFKHVVGKESEERARNFRVLINEITILGQPTFHAHPNIVTIHGVCWHTPTGEERVEPALVFERAEHRDLYRFMTSSAGLKLNLMDRIHICVDIARGLIHSHECGVLHGDVKPQNVLIFGSESPYTAKVADFGFSSLASSGEVALAISRPWEAPELIECESSPKFGFPAAIRVEAYSFGLLCLWVLFHELRFDTSETTIGDLFTNNGVQMLQRLKKEGKMLEIALAMLDSSSTIPESLKARLNSVFRFLLPLEPAYRTSDLNDILLEVECSRNLAITGLKHTMVKPIIAHFKVIESLVVFVESHLIVRKYIVFSLREQYETTSCSECRENARIQIWLCYKLGFGNPLEVTTGAKQDFQDSEISREVDILLERALNITIDTSRRSDALLAFDDHGFLGTLEYSDEYVKTPIQEALDDEYPMEIEKMAQALGKFHVLVYTLKMYYCSILYRQGAYREALPLVIALDEDLKQDIVYGPEHVRSQRITTLLAALHWALGEYEKAYGLEVDLLAAWEKIQGKENLGYIHLQRSHASTLRDQGGYEDAAAVEELLLKTAAAVLGEKHPEYLAIMANLAVTYSNGGKYAESEDLELKVLNARREVLGPRHRDTVMAMANLAFTYRDLERWDDAEDLERLVMRDRQDIFGAENPETLRSMVNLANTWMNQGYFAEDDDREKHDTKFHEAHELLLKTVEISQRVLGVDHLDTLMAISSLNHCYRNTGHLAKAELLDQQLISSRTSILGDTHPTTLKSIFNYALTLRELGKTEAAKIQATICLVGRTDVLGPDHPLTLDTQLFLDSLPTYYVKKHNVSQ